MVGRGGMLVAVGKPRMVGLAGFFTNRNCEKRFVICLVLIHQEWFLMNRNCETTCVLAIDYVWLVPTECLQSCVESFSPEG